MEERELENEVKVCEVDKIHNLVFSGGSVRGVAYVGAIQALEAAGCPLTQIKCVAGTSAGAITALLVALGCKSEELKRLEEILSKDYFSTHAQGKMPAKGLKVIDSPSTLFGGIKAVKAVPVTIHSLANHYGLINTDIFVQWFAKLIYEKTGKTDLTFQELVELAANNPKFKELTVTGANLNAQDTILFNATNTPKVLIAHAVAISMSIPLLFQPRQIMYKSKRGQICIDSKGHYYVDGGLLDNYPLWVFDDKYQKNETLGFMLTEKKNKDYLENQREIPEEAIDGFVAFTKALYSTQRRGEIAVHKRNPEERRRTVYIDTVGVGTLDFHYGDKEKAKLITAGKEAVENFFGKKATLSIIPSANLMVRRK